MRLIDIEAVLKAAELAGKEYVSIDLLKDLEQIDAVPVVRGEWIKKLNPNWQAYSHEHCSICGWENGIQAKKYRGLNYCPNCGAKMEDKPCE